MLLGEKCAAEECANTIHNIIDKLNTDKQKGKPKQWHNEQRHEGETMERDEVIIRKLFEWRMDERFIVRLSGMSGTRMEKRRSSNDPELLPKHAKDAQIKPASGG